MGADPSAPRPSKSLRSIAKGLERNYPSIVRSLGQQILPQARYEIGAQEEIAPREQALGAGLYSQYAPIYGEAGSAVDLGALQGSGRASVLAADELERQIDPEYYGMRASSANKLGQLLGGIDPNRLTGAEEEAVARGLARSGYRTGELAVPTSGGAIKAALTYGRALDQKRNTVANAINTATAALPGFRSGIDVFSRATGGARLGVNPFAGGQNFGGQAGQASQALGQGIVGSLTQLGLQRNQLQSQRRDELDRYNESQLGGIGTIL